MTEELIAATSDETVRKRAQSLLDAAFQQDNFVEFARGQNFLDVFLDIAEMRKNIREPRKSTYRMTESERQQERERREKALTRNYTDMGPAALCVACGVDPQQIGIKLPSVFTWNRYLESGREIFLPKKLEDPKVVEANTDAYFHALTRYFGERDTLLERYIDNDDTKSRKPTWTWDTNLIARRLLENLGVSYQPFLLFSFLMDWCSIYLQVIEFRHATTDGTVEKPPPPPPAPKAPVEATPVRNDTAPTSAATHILPSVSTSAFTLTSKKELSSSSSASASAPSSASSAAPVSAFSFTFTPPALVSVPASAPASTPASMSPAEVSSSESSSEHTPKPRTIVEHGSELGLEPVSEAEPTIVAVPEREQQSADLQEVAPVEHVQPIIENAEVSEPNVSEKSVEIKQISPEPVYSSHSQLLLQNQPLPEVKAELEPMAASLPSPVSPVSPKLPESSESPNCENESPSEETQFEYIESQASDACVEEGQERPTVDPIGVSLSPRSPPSALPISAIHTARSATPASPAIPTPVKRVQVDWRQEALAEEAALAAQNKPHSQTPQKQRTLGGNNNNNNNNNNHNSPTNAAVKGYHRRRSQGQKGTKNKGGSA